MKIIIVISVSLFFVLAVLAHINSRKVSAVLSNNLFNFHGIYLISSLGSVMVELAGRNPRLRVVSSPLVVSPDDALTPFLSIPLRFYDFQRRSSVNQCRPSRLPGASRLRALCQSLPGNVVVARRLHNPARDGVSTSANAAPGAVADYGSYRLHGVWWNWPDSIPACAFDALVRSRPAPISIPARCFLGAGFGHSGTLPDAVPKTMPGLALTHPLAHPLDYRAWGGFWAN